jgi:hypothetical protein
LAGYDSKRFKHRENAKKSAFSGLFAQFMAEKERLLSVTFKNNAHEAL